MGLFGWDLPPGVRDCDIPGNRPEDIAAEEAFNRAWDKLSDFVNDELAPLQEHGLDELGLVADWLEDAKLTRAIQHDRKRYD